MSDDDFCAAIGKAWADAWDAVDWQRAAQEAEADRDRAMAKLKARMDATESAE